MDKTPEGKTPKRYKGEGRVNFLAHLESIREAVQAGWPIKAVYDQHQDRLIIRYAQFIKYVDQYIKGKEPTKPKLVHASIPPKPKASFPNEPRDIPTKSIQDATPLPDSELF